MGDPDIEYLFKPNQRCRRFGHTITYNEYSMRGTPNFPAKKVDPAQLRVLVIGDSVVNGGVMTDDADLVTRALEKRLSNNLKRPVLVMNVSAGSWGPPNQLAYLRRFGLFEADVVVLVMNDGDYADNPTFAPTVGVSPSFPDRKPILALWEGFERYLLPRLSSHRGNSMNEMGLAPPHANPSDVEACDQSEKDIYELVKGSGAKCMLALYPSKINLNVGEIMGFDSPRRVATNAAIPFIELNDALRKAAGTGEVYRDAIHPTALGQRFMADALASKIEDLLR